MRKSTINAENLERFAFVVSSPIVARHFRDYCHRNGLIMGAALERMIVKFLLEAGDIESEESLAVEEALTK